MSLIKTSLGQNLMGKRLDYKKSTSRRMRQKSNYNEFRHTMGFPHQSKIFKSELRHSMLMNQLKVIDLTWSTAHLRTKAMISKQNMVPMKPNTPHDCHPKQVLQLTSLCEIHLLKK